MTDGCLYYFQYTTVSTLPKKKTNHPKIRKVVILDCFPPQDKEPKGIIPLENLSVREMEDTHKQVHLHVLFIPPKRFIKHDHDLTDSISLLDLLLYFVVKLVIYDV